MAKLTELDKAQLRHEARELLLEHGFDGLLDALTETIAVSEAFMEVAKDEFNKQFPPDNTMGDSK